MMEKKLYEGGQTITYKAPLSVVPVLVKKGAVIPMMPVMQYIGEKERSSIIPARISCRSYQPRFF